MDADQLQDWLELAERKLKEAFGARLLFLGLQGSRGRREGRTDSDIDLVVILDRVDREDWSTYRAVLAEMPSRELACGFFSGAAQLANWDRADLFQFVHDTTPILGDLACVAPAPGRAEAARALQECGVQTELIWLGNDALRDCVACGHCNGRCPFHVDQVGRMEEIRAYFG